jgi:hypothetical protein
VKESPDAVVVIVAYETSASSPPPTFPSDVHALTVATCPRGDVDRSSPPPPVPYVSLLLPLEIDLRRKRERGGKEGG